MRKLCCACHSSSIAALIHIMVVPDVHGQRHCEIKASRLRLPRTEALHQRLRQRRASAATAEGKRRSAGQREGIDAALDTPGLLGVADPE